MYSFCTLFDSNYLDKGLVTVESLKRHIEQEKVYILAMDLKCYEILTKWYAKEKDVVIVSLDDFEDEELKEVKKRRTRAEYCWTCSASLIKYVLEVYQEEYCTYIDADLCFYNDPRCIIEEMEQKNKTVQIIEHRFKMNYEGKLQELNSGRFCVEFMTFKNEDKARYVLDTWRGQILDKCNAEQDMNSFGDQMYLNSWEDDYDCVWVTNHVGAGVAPWNINRYNLKQELGDNIILSFDKKKQDIPLIFYHFHRISYLSAEEVNIDVRTHYWKVDEQLVRKLYIEYLRAVEKKKDILEKKYGFRPLYIAAKRKEKRKINFYEVLCRPKLMWRVRYTIANLVRGFIYAKKDIICLKEIM